MFVTLEKLAQVEPKYADIFLIENYAAFQNRFVFISQEMRKLKAASVSCMLSRFCIRRQKIFTCYFVCFAQFI
jgi:hypothetical protein